ncbi:hypothetical protein [Pseudomonas fluorescens]|uniref:hypothetical protein n=1 Tax=Pseudomonas fluorescens TaxID=294 RepID=UPI001A9CEC29|nr:hypothetical protein [Pseudomonas fluorescens]QTD31688.1 hypothetical protein JZM58_20650 [Pseudomonas fluorescens]
MNNLTIRWLTNFMIGVGTGFLVTGFAALLIGDLTDVDTIRAGALMATSSIFLMPPLSQLPCSRINHDGFNSVSLVIGL